MHQGEGKEHSSSSSLALTRSQSQAFIPRCACEKPGEACGVRDVCVGLSAGLSALGGQGLRSVLFTVAESSAQQSGCSGMVCCVND